MYTNIKMKEKESKAFYQIITKQKSFTYCTSETYGIYFSIIFKKSFQNLKEKQYNLALEIHNTKFTILYHYYNLPVNYSKSSQSPFKMFSFDNDLISINVIFH